MHPRVFNYGIIALSKKEKRNKKTHLFARGEMGQINRNCFVIQDDLVCASLEGDWLVNAGNGIWRRTDDLMV